MKMLNGFFCLHAKIRHPACLGLVLESAAFGFYLKLSQLEDAEDALSEANILNNKAPEVWAYLSLICLKTNRPLEAEQAYKYSIKLNLDNQALLDEIHIMQEQMGFGNPEL